MSTKTAGLVIHFALFATEEINSSAQPAKRDSSKLIKDLVALTHAQEDFMEII